jgi:glutathione S-transferase
MITLYDFANSVACQKVRIALCEKDLAWETIKVDLFRSEQYDPEYLEFNPKGVVPTLIHDGKPIIESTLICEYLEDKFPEPRLIPIDPWHRARMRVWTKTVDEGLHEGITEISFSAVFRERMKNMPAELRESRFHNIGDPRRRDRFKSTFELGTQSPFVLYAAAAYDGVRCAGSHTGRRWPWILGDKPTLAGMALMPYVARLYYRGLLGVWTQNRTHIGDWWGQVQEWPSFKRGLRDRVSEDEFAEMRTHGPKIRAEIDALVSGLPQQSY